MLKNYSIYEAIVRGETVRAESATVHAPRAELHIVYWGGERITSYINPIGDEEGIVPPPRKCIVRSYPAKRIGQRSYKETVDYPPWAGSCMVDGNR